MSATALSRVEMGANYLSEREPIHPNSLVTRTDRAAKNFWQTTFLAIGVLTVAGGLFLAALGTVITGYTAIKTNDIALGIVYVTTGVLGAAAAACGGAHTTAGVISATMDLPRSPEKIRNDSKPASTSETIKAMSCLGLFCGPTVSALGFGWAWVATYAAGGNQVLAVTATAAAALGGVATVVGGTLVGNALNSVAKVDLTLLS